MKTVQSVVAKIIAPLESFVSLKETNNKNVINAATDINNRIV